MDLNILFTLGKDNFADLAHFIVSFRNGPGVSFGTYIPCTSCRKGGREERKIAKIYVVV